MTRLNIFKTLGRIGNRFIPRHLFPGIFNALTNHWFGDAVFVRGITECKSTFDTSMAFVGFTVFIGRHAHYFIAFHLSLKRTANPAVSTGCNHRMFRLTRINNAFLCERCSRARINTGTAGHAVRIHEVISRPNTNLGLEAPAINGKGESPLGLLTGSNTT